jgi:hypothetical protein
MLPCWLRSTTVHRFDLREDREELVTRHSVLQGRIPAHGGQFPARRCKFPARRNKFPVWRELIPCFILQGIVLHLTDFATFLRAIFRQNGPILVNIPCKFPVSREFRPETGSRSAVRQWDASIVRFLCCETLKKIIPPDHPGSGLTLPVVGAHFLAKT